jgi:hypothetical protein
LSDIILRFFVGGMVVSLFASLGDLFKPKSFAGLFGAAPSVALATLGLAVLKQGEQYAATEARSMVAGLAGFRPRRQFSSFAYIRYSSLLVKVTEARRKRHSICLCGVGHVDLTGVLAVIALNNYGNRRPISQDPLPSMAT